MGRFEDEGYTLVEAHRDICWCIREIEGDENDDKVGLKERMKKVEGRLEELKETRRLEEAQREWREKQLKRAWSVITLFGGGGIVAAIAYILRGIQGG